LRTLIVFLATGAGSGYSPVAPGTAGSVVGLLIFAAGLGSLSAPLYLLTLLSAIAVAIWASDGAIAIFGSKDPRQVTIDEVVGMLTALALVPGAASGPSRWILLGLAFLFFRIFDILKPAPVRTIERAAPGGFGVVLDDVAAGIYANLSLRIAAHLLHLS
jgi:phosphatidylglycerophosphatase A